MISREWAVELVERHLASDETRRLQPLPVIVGVERHVLGWLIVCQSPEFARTGDLRDAWVGDGSFLIDALDGSLHTVHKQFCNDDLEWQDQYREKVRKEIPPSDLDTEVRRLTRLGHRRDAFTAVRNAGGGLNPADCLRYVDAITSGTEPPDDLVARLPHPDRRYLAIATHSGPNPELADWRRMTK
ncbi:YrhB domain-containing protein [Streptomyces sp. H39-S7]|uniref:YrhB domain-containing protein n=1 Tax=Streptomyces sp. H39-S7 TaxID=3004357 RepID=UPI0022AF5746|nr:YrhB domain-containing protein [Streptomyces sp. H39-S7]MCZ4119879.1 YrhB domain-containing protein [Streptomyces sp. H39-S7]